MEIMETKVCGKSGIAVPTNPLEIKEMIRTLNESPQNLLSILAECSKYHEQAWHYNTNVFENTQRIILTTSKKKSESSDDMECDFSDFMNEEEFERLQEKLAKTKPSEVMY